jgi:hypothetical protein
MPIPSPSPKENAEIFIQRCISEIVREYDEPAQAVAICKQKWNDKNNMKEEQKEIFVVTPKKNENRGNYLSRCSAHSKMRAQFPNMKERMGTCLNAFNAYYKYWSRLEDFNEADTTGTALGDCIAKEKAKGFDYRESYNHCASKVVVTAGPIVLNEDNLIVEPVAMSEDVSVDFDDTFNTDAGKELVQKLIDEGVVVHIITRRQQSASKPVYDLATEYGIPKDRVHFTNGKLKWEMIKTLGIKKHIDNNPDELKAIKENLPDVIAEKFM